MPPLVSAVVPTYNRARYLPEAIASVLAQTSEDLELIVVDDGSTDETAEVVRGFDDGRIRYIYQANQGRSAARNRGAREARGEFLGILDSDDCYLPGAFEAHLQVFAGQVDLGMTVGGYQGIDEAGRLLGERRPWEEGGELDLAGWLFNCFGIPGSVLLRREWFERAGGYDRAIHGADDWDSFLQLAVRGCRMAWVRQAVCQYRQYPGGSIQSGGIPAHKRGMLLALDKVFRAAELQPQVAALRTPATAWAHVHIAKMHYLAGNGPQASAELVEALRLQPDLAEAKRLSLLEFLLAPPPDWPGPPGRLGALILEHRPGMLRVGSGDVRRAQARAEMARFFAAVGRRDEIGAMPHFRAGLKLDPRWLANRGVLAFGLRALSRRFRPAT
jgi:hypothetical protein